MNRDDKLKDKLVGYIHDAYAMENQIIEVLQKQVDRAKEVPQIQAKIQQHLDQTRQHRARMEQCLQTYGEQPSTMKGAMTSLMGNMAGMMGGARGDTLAKDARDDYVTEHLEIVAYTMLMTTANAYGDQQTMQAAAANLRDEVEMQRWLAQHAPEATLLSLQQGGINVPDSAWQFARQSQGELHPAEALIGMDLAAKGMSAKETFGAGAASTPVNAGDGMTLTE